VNLSRCLGDCNVNVTASPRTLIQFWYGGQQVSFIQYTSAIRLCDDKFGDNLTGEDRLKIPNMGSGIVGGNQDRLICLG
jgi:hypothetical protein